MSERLDDDLSLDQLILQTADSATGMTGDLAAWVTWLVPFAPKNAIAQLQFLYGKQGLYGKRRTLASATATIALLDRLLAEPDEVHTRLQAHLDEATGDGFQLLALIEWRLAQRQEGAAPLSVLRTLLARMRARAQPTTTSDRAGERDVPPRAALYRLVDQAANQIDEITALVKWLLPFAPEEGVREVETIRAITRSYRPALDTVQSLDQLLANPWQSPREYVFGDLSLVATLIDERIEKGRGNRHRLEKIKEQILKTQRLETQAAARRRAVEARKLLTYRKEDPEPAPPDDDESTGH